MKSYQNNFKKDVFKGLFRSLKTEQKVRFDTLKGFYLKN